MGGYSGIWVFKSDAPFRAWLEKSKLVEARFVLLLDWQDVVRRYFEETKF
jgi:hypothetical protein